MASSDAIVGSNNLHSEDDRTFFKKFLCPHVYCYKEFIFVFIFWLTTFYDLYFCRMSDSLLFFIMALPNFLLCSSLPMPSVDATLINNENVGGR